MADQITGTQVRLMSGVPFHVDYKHTRHFTNRSAQSSYFDAMTTTYQSNQANFIRIEGRFKYRTNQNIEMLHNTNYIRFNNQTPGGSTSKRFYGFVTHMEYVNSNVTDVWFEVDVIQTFMFDYTWRQSFIAREHGNFRLGFNDSPAYIGREIPTIDEGLFYGTEYETNWVHHVKNAFDVRWLVIVTSDPIHEMEGAGHFEPSYVVNPQPLYYYVVPFRPNGNSMTVNIGSQSLQTSNPLYTITRLFGQRGTVGHVVSMYVTEDIGLAITNTTESAITVNTTGGWQLERHMLLGNIDDPIGSDVGGYALFVKQVREFTPRHFTISNNVWNMLREKVATPESNVNITEHKLYTSPYHWIEMHDYRGNMIKIRPEYLKENKLVVTRKGSLGLSNKVSYHIRYYANHWKSEPLAIATEHEHALIDQMPNDISIKNEHLAAFIQGNKNQLSQERTQAGLNALFSVADGAIGVAGAIGDGARAYGTRGGSGPPGVASAVSGGIQGLANSAMVVAGQQAKKSDLANMPASISKMGGNTAFDIGYGFTGVFLVFKSIKNEYKKTINDYFHAFGYKSNQLKIPNLTTRPRFNYVQTNEANITGNINQNYLEQIRAIFNSGITLWHTNAVGDYAGDNQPN